MGIRQSANAFVAAGGATLAASLPSTAAAGNLLIWAAAMDKQPGTLTMSGSGWSTPINLRSASVSLAVSWKTATGGETSLSGTVGGTAPPSGSRVWVAEIEQTGTGAWTVVSASNNTTESPVTSQSTGTTPTTSVDGTAFAFWAVDSEFNMGSGATYTNGFTQLFMSSTAGDGGEAGLWVASADVSAGSTVSCTLTQTGSPTADQMSGAVLVAGRGTPAGGGGAVTFRGATDDARGTATPAEPALPAGVVEGGLLVAIQTSDLNGSLAAMTAPAGWTERGSSSRSDVGFMKVWTKVATGSEPATYQFPDSASAHGSAIIVAVTGQDPTTPLAVTPTFASGAAAADHPAPSVAGVANGLLLTAHLAGTAGTLRTYTAPSAMTVADTSSLTSGNSPNILTGAYYQELAATGQTGTKSATCSASRPYVTMSLVVAPVSAVTTVNPDTAEGTGGAGAASQTASSRATPAGGVATGAALTPTRTAVSRTFVTAGRGSAGGTASNATVATSSSTSTTVTAGATASGSALGSNTGAALGFTVRSEETQSPTGLFPSNLLFPSESLFPSAGEGATAQTVSPVGIESGETIGSPVVSLADGPQDVIATSIGSAEAFGVPTITLEVGPQDVTAVGGIGTAEAFGRPTLSVEVAPPPPPPPAAQYLDTYYVDGIDLAQYTTQIEVAEGLQDTPGAYGDDVVLPGRDGLLEVWGGPGQQRRPDGPGKWVCSMWLIGVDPTTGELLDPADSAAAYQARWDELVRVFHRRRLTIDHPRPDGTRRAVGYLTPGESMVPTSRAASPWFGRFKASVTIPAGHWTDPVEVTTGPTSLATNGVLSLSPWAAATAPCTELVITFGSGNNPRLSTSYGFVGWNGTIAPGRQLTIDTASSQLGYGSGQVWTPDYGGLVYSPGPRLFEIDPSEPLQAVLTHTGGGSMTVEVSGRRRYRTS